MLGGVQEQLVDLVTTSHAPDPRRGLHGRRAARAHPEVRHREPRRAGERLARARRRCRCLSMAARGDGRRRRSYARRSRSTPRDRTTSAETLSQRARQAGRHRGSGIDAALHGIVIVIDERRQVSLDLGGPARGARAQARADQRLRGDPRRAARGRQGSHRARAPRGTWSSARRTSGALSTTSGATTCCFAAKVALDDTIVEDLAAKLGEAAGRPIRVEPGSEPAARGGSRAPGRRRPAHRARRPLCMAERPRTGASRSHRREPRHADAHRTSSCARPSSPANPNCASRRCARAARVLDIGDGIATVAA